MFSKPSSLVTLLLTTIITQVSYGQQPDVRLSNYTLPGNGTLTVDVDIQSANTTGSFTFGPQFNTAALIYVTYDNEGTGAGQMNATSTANPPSGYSLGVFDDNGFCYFQVSRGFSSITIAENTWQRVGTIIFTLGSGTNNTHSVNLGITLGNTSVRDGSGNALTINSVTGLSSQTLPINLINFNASFKDGYVFLNWETSIEENNDGFEIQRSNNGIDFESIGWVDGSGNSLTPIEYTFKDLDAHFDNESVFYRFKQIDFDGKFEYSPTRSLTIENRLSHKVNWFPNPATNLITVQSDESQLIDIYDISGKTVLNTNTKESNTIDLANLEKGTYLMLFKNMNGEIVQQDKLFIL